MTAPERVAGELVEGGPSPEFVRRTRNPSVEPPARFEPVPKQPGSFELVRGEWVEVRHAS